MCTLCRKASRSCKYEDSTANVAEREDQARTTTTEEGQSGLSEGSLAPPTNIASLEAAGTGVVSQASPSNGVTTTGQTFETLESIFQTPTSAGFVPVAIPSHDDCYSQVSPNNVSVISGQFLSDVDDAAAHWFDLLAGDASLDLEDSAETPAQHDAPNTQQLEAVSEPQAWSLGGNIRQVLPPIFTETSLWTLSNPLQLNHHELKILENFIYNVASWMDIFDPWRHYSILVPRLSMRNVGLLNAILALSTRHLSLNPHLTQGILYTRNDALEYYHSTLKYVQKAMQYDSYNTSDELLATALIISAYEMLDGGRRDWERHLQGVFGIQRSQVIHGDSGGLRGARWWSWLCQDCWAAFRDKRKPFTFWKPQRTSFKQMTSWELAARSLFVFAKVVGYCAERTEEESSESFNKRSDQAKALSRMLEDWWNSLPIDFEPLPTSTQDGGVFHNILIHPPAFGVAVQLHNAAKILLSLYRPLLGGMNMFVEQQKLLNECVNQICGIAKGLADSASNILSSQCLFIAGTCTQDAQRREEIVRLMQACRHDIGWPVKPLEEDLRDLWQASK